MVDGILILFVHVSESRHVECQFHSAVETFGILEFLGYHLLEGLTGEEDDAHIAQCHLHIGLDAVPLSGEAEYLCVEFNGGLVVTGEQSDGVENESGRGICFFHCRCQFV